MRSWIVALWILSIITCISPAKAQVGEVGFSLGTSNFIGDLGKKETDGKSFFSDIQASVFRPAFGAFFRSTVHPFFAFRANITYGRLYGDDRLADYNKIGEDAWFRNYRNLHFRSHVLELSAIGEVHLLPYTPGSRRNKFAPYVMGGVGFFTFDPRAEYQGEWVRLRPLGTEGQGLPNHPDRKKYSLIQPCVILGLGMKYNINREWSVNLEVGQRYTFTDYIDDVSRTYVSKNDFFSHYEPERANLIYNLSRRSQEIDPEGLYRNITGVGEPRGNPGAKDSYFLIMATVTYKLYGSAHDYRNPFQKKKTANKYRKAFRR